MSLLYNVVTLRSCWSFGFEAKLRILHNHKQWHILNHHTIHTILGKNQSFIKWTWLQIWEAGYPFSTARQLRWVRHFISYPSQVRDVKRGGGVKSMVSTVGYLQSDGTEVMAITRSPLGLLLLQQFLALLSSAFVDGVARVVDLKGVLVLHVRVLHFPCLFIEMQHVRHPKAIRGKNETMRTSCLHYKHLPPHLLSFPTLSFISPSFLPPFFHLSLHVPSLHPLPSFIPYHSPYPLYTILPSHHPLPSFIPSFHPFFSRPACSLYSFHPSIYPAFLIVPSSTKSFFSPSSLLTSVMISLLLFFHPSVSFRSCLVDHQTILNQTKGKHGRGSWAQQGGEHGSLFVIRTRILPREWVWSRPSGWKRRNTCCYYQEIWK